MEIDREELIREARRLIGEELGECNAELWPNLCSLRSTKEGYERVEEMVFRYIVKEAMPIGAAIALIEQELQHAGD